MTVQEVIQFVMGSGMLAQMAIMLKWVIRVETRLAVIETQMKDK